MPQNHFQNLFYPISETPGYKAINTFGPGESLGLPDDSELLRKINNPFDPSQAPVTRNRFEGMFEPQGNLSQRESIPQEPQGSRISELYSPETYFQDEYKKLLSELPQRNKPGIWRKIGASIVSAGGHNPDDFLYAPYKRQMEDWNLKKNAIEPGLQAERYANINERQLASSEMQNQTAMRRSDISERNIASLENKRIADIEKDKERTKIQANRAETYRYRTEHPNHELTEDEQGNLMAFNPQSKQIEYLLDDDGQPIKGTALSEFDRLKLQIKGRQDVARLEGSIDAGLESQRQKNRVELERVEAENIAKREKEKAAADKDKVEVTTGTVTVTDKDGKPIGTRKTTTQKTTQAGRNVGVKMRAPNGKIVLVPKDKVEEAKKKGGKVVP